MGRGKNPDPRPSGRKPDELTIVEAAAVLRVSPEAVSRRVQSGRLPSRLVPRLDGLGTGVRLVRRADVEALLPAAAPSEPDAAPEPDPEPEPVVEPPTTAYLRPLPPEELARLRAAVGHTPGRRYDGERKP